MRPNILMIPGLGGSGPEHWQSVWERELPTCRRVGQRNWDKPDRAEWVAVLDRFVADSPGPVVLVAHSLACALTACWVQDRGNGKAVGALLVAPSDVDSAEHTPPEARCFSPLPLAVLPFRSILLASRDDPYVDFNRAKVFAASWGSDFVDLGAAGHINAASGLGNWPEGKRHLGALMDT